MPASPRTRALLALPLLLAAVAGCGAGSSDGGQLRVSTSFYPLEELVREIGGSRVEVSNLTPPGAEPHGIELRAEQLVALERADLVVYLGGDFQPRVEEAISSLGGDVQRLDVLIGQRLRPSRNAEAADPHIWLDPNRLAGVVIPVADALTRADPGGREAFEAGMRRTLAKLSALDREFADGLDRCRSRTIVTSHAAFGYLAARHDLRQVPIAGLSPEIEPDPKTLSRVAGIARRSGATTIFFETLSSDRLARTVAEEIGVRTDVLNPIEGLTADQIAAGEDYFSVQRENLARLRRALGCQSS